MPSPEQLALLNRERLEMEKREQLQVERVRLRSLAEELEGMRLGELSEEGRRRWAAFEEQREREGMARLAEEKRDVRIYLDYVAGQQKEVAARAVQDLTRVREFRAMVSERELIERMVLNDYSRAERQRVLAKVRRQYPKPPKNGALLDRKPVVVINAPAFRALVARARVRSAFAKSNQLV